MNAVCRAKQTAPLYSEIHYVHWRSMAAVFSCIKKKEAQFIQVELWVRWCYDYAEINQLYCA